MPRAKKGSSEPAFEQALGRLEEIARNLEKGDLPLEDSLRLFEEGVRLTRLCAAQLDQAQRRIDLLTRATDGELKLEPFAALEETGSAPLDPAGGGGSQGGENPDDRSDP